MPTFAPRSHICTPPSATTDETNLLLHRLNTPGLVEFGLGDERADRGCCQFLVWTRLRAWPRSVPRQQKTSNCVRDFQHGPMSLVFGKPHLVGAILPTHQVLQAHGTVIVRLCVAVEVYQVFILDLDRGRPLHPIPCERLAGLSQWTIRVISQTQPTSFLQVPSILRAGA